MHVSSGATGNGIHLRGHETALQELQVNRRARGYVSTNPIEPEEVNVEACPLQSSPPLGSSGTTTFGRIGRIFSPTTCSDSVFQGPFGTDERYYEQVGPFSHPQDACVTVRVDLGTCVFNGNALVFLTAYTFFDPSDFYSGYLGGVGNPDDYQSFSFSLPANTPFYAVAYQIMGKDYDVPDGYEGPPPNGNDCVFSVEVDFGEGCTPNTFPDPTTTPPPPPLPATHLDECVQYDSSPMGSSGVSVRGEPRNNSPTTCVGLNLYSGVLGRTTSSYEEIGPFVNTNSFRCVTVWVDPGTCVDSTGKTMVHVSAHLDSFDPAHQGDNYVGGIGNPQAYSYFAFPVPTERAFTLVGRQLSGENMNGCVFSVIVDVNQECL